MKSASARNCVVIGCCTLALSSGLIFPVAAYGQQASSGTLDEVIVTARKRDERLLDVPIAVTSISAGRIVAESLTRLEDVTQAVPNLSIASGGTDAGGTDFGVVYIRGIGQIDYANSIDPGVGTYVDGVYLGRAVGGNLDLSDVHSVEVLRGPQGTLFGKNTMGGAINVTTTRPSFTDRATVSLTGGEYNTFNEEVDGDLKFSDQVGMHADFVHRHQDGYIQRYYGGDALGADDRWIGRVKLEFRIDETLNILLSGDYTSSHGTNAKVDRIFDPAQVGDFLGVLWNNVPPAAAPFIFGYPPVPGLPTVPESVLQGERISPANDHNSLRQSGAIGSMPMDENIGGGALRIEKQFAGFTLRSISGYRTLSSSVGGDQDGQKAYISYALWNDEQHQISEEINALGKAFNDKLDWLVGGYFFTEKAGAQQTIREDQPWFMVNIMFGTRTDSYAGFGESTWHFNDEWSLVTGVRYTTETKDFYANQLCLPGMLLPCAPGGVFLPYTTSSASWSSTDPRVTLQYRPVPNWLTYATFSTGFKSGGFNARAANPAAAQTPFQPETLHAFEAGAKGSFYDNRATLTFAAFKYNYDSLQMVVSGLNPATKTPVAVVGNLGDAELWGGESEFTFRPIRAFQLNAAIGYTHAKYTSLSPSVLALLTAFNTPAVSLQSQLPRTPLVTGNLGAQYTLTLPNRNSLTFRADYSYVDKQYNDIQNFAQTESPAHYNVNARITYMHGERWEAALWAKNLTNEAYVENAFWPAGSNSADVFIIPNMPRVIGATVSVNF